MSQAKNPFDKTVAHSVYVPRSINDKILRMAEVNGMSISEYLVACASKDLEEQKLSKQRLDYVFQENE